MFQIQFSPREAAVSWYLTYEVLGDDCAYGGDSGGHDVLIELLQEDGLAEVVLPTECVVDTPKKQVPMCVCQVQCIMKTVYVNFTLIVIKTNLHNCLFPKYL